MPPKRAAAGTSSAPKKSPAASAADGADSAASSASEPAIPRSKRWSPVSGSANADAHYKLKMQNPVTAYSFVCLCRPPFPNGEDSDEDDEEDDDEEDGDEEGREVEDGEESAKKKRSVCDGGKTCLCDKPASEHPDHVWKMSAAGKLKFLIQRTHFALRDPDNFSMYTFNDHLGYGVLEMLQNLVLDYEEAAGNYKEQWAVCECLAFFLQTEGWIDDGDTVDATFELIGRLFMAMLAQLERQQLLSKDSEIKNLGLVMALFMAWARGARQYGLLEDEKEESLGPAKNKKKWQPSFFDNQILAYARKYEIDLVGPHDIDETVAEARGDVALPDPESSSTAKADPFGFAKALKKYKVEAGGISAFLSQNYSSNSPIGGDNLDITTWSSAARKSKCFDKKDPLSKAEIDALKQGMVLTLG
ncbi:695b8046-1e8c-4982-a7a8-4e2cd759b51b [Thermothielavioides terrestris]|uniref:695b8046-1e8c-4982-a7a8-4e2cd759b51b n=1 Tax=Thermothielavioides terrestris TaxID=2587410 RepID=A0A3S4AUQ7_9PEZI|nr:695b8046-1e8c-4982-a7a8-4e2cd759b51b [Thermothielavioides terrestris]